MGDYYFDEIFLDIIENCLDCEVITGKNWSKRKRSR